MSAPKNKKTLVGLCLLNWLWIGLLSAQTTLLESLNFLSDTMTIQQKYQLRNQLKGQLFSITEPFEKWQFVQQYHELAQAKKDTIFLTHSTDQLALLSAVTSDTFKYQLLKDKLISRSGIEQIYLNENTNFIYRFVEDEQTQIHFENHQQLQSQYGIFTTEFLNEEVLDIYNALTIFKEKEELTLEYILTRQPSFQLNNTLVDFDSNATYWVKLKLKGQEMQADTVSFFVENMAGFTSWHTIQAYLVHENGQIDQQRTGIGLSREEKPLFLPNNVVQFVISPNEKATLYLRLSGTGGKRIPRYISLLGIRNTDLAQSDFYQTDGTFRYANGYTPFRGNKITNRKIFIDRTKQQSINYIAANWDNLPFADAYNTNFSEDQSYWTRLRLVGNEAFNGTQFFHASPYPFVGADGFNFRQIDYFFRDQEGQLIHRKTGYNVPSSEKAYDFWANFLKVEVPKTDTLDLFVRLEGGNPRFLMSRLDFWHIDPSSVFPNQMKEAIKNALYYGILGIQFLFFILLFRIEKARIHLYFSMIILGVFLSQGYGEDNYRFFVPFPSFRDYHSALFFTGLFLIQFGFLKFTSSYFNYAKTSFVNRFFIPIFLGCSALVNLNAVTKFSYTNFSEYPVSKPYYILTILFMLLGITTTFVIGVSVKVKNRTPKLFFILAFLPGLLTALFFLLRVVIGAIYGNAFSNSLFPAFIFTYDSIKVSIVLMLFLFALSMGYRTNLLKAEKQNALKNNLKAQRTIIEKLQQTDQLQALDRLKTRFFTNITHEFRTPLTVILGMATQKNNPDTLPLIRRNGQKLLNLVNQLLDLSKLDSGHLQPNFQQIEIVSFTKYIGESFQSLADRKFIRLMVYSEINEVWLDMDEEKYRQIISNLLSNAIKFTPESGKIILHLNQKEKTLHLKISDNGIGIPKRELPLIFNRFYQVENAASQQGKGTGIGLALVNELVDLLGGKITVISELEKGTTFNLQFPIRTITAKASVSHKTLTDTNELLPRLIIDEVEKKEESPTLLIVEDNADVVVYIQSLLAQQYNLQIARNGEEGIEKAIETVPDLILSDVMMPKKDGFELVATLKQDERTSHIPIILLTAKAAQQDKLDGLKYGADAYLVKPFDKVELTIRLEQLLTLRQRLQAKYVTTTIPEIIVEKEKNLEELFLEKLGTVLENHYGDATLDVKQISSLLNMSYLQLNRKLKALTNQTPVKYLQIFRLKKAKTLLLNPNNSLNVSEVAYHVGFTDPNYFSRIFRALFGHSPNSIRK